MVDSSARMNLKNFVRNVIYKGRIILLINLSRMELQK
jgi:hypothetical protein